MKGPGIFKVSIMKLPTKYTISYRATYPKLPIRAINQLFCATRTWPSKYVPAALMTHAETRARYWTLLTTFFFEGAFRIEPQTSTQGIAGEGQSNVAFNKRPPPRAHFIYPLFLVCPSAHRYNSKNKFVRQLTVLFKPTRRQYTS